MNYVGTTPGHMTERHGARTSSATGVTASPTGETTTIRTSMTFFSLRTTITPLRIYKAAHIGSWNRDSRTGLSSALSFGA